MNNSKIIHLLGSLTFVLAMYYEFWIIVVPPSFPAMTEFPGRSKYLTTWNLVLLVAYQIYSLFNDFVGSNELSIRRQSSFQKIRDALFASWIFPTGIFVSSTFWALYMLDRELVFPVAMDTFYPTFQNHALHTGPPIFLMLEVTLVPKIWPSRSGAVLGTLGFVTTYLGWITWVFLYTGMWPYPILQVLNNVQRAAFLGTLAVSLVGLYFVGEGLHKLFWGHGAGIVWNQSPKVTSTRGKSLSKGRKML